MLAAVLLAGIALSGCGGHEGDRIGGPPAPGVTQAQTFKADAQGNVKAIITFKVQPAAAEQQLVRRLGGEVKFTYHIIPGIAATLPEMAIEALQKNPNVLRVEPDGLCWAIQQTLPWGVERIDADLVHSTNKGAGVKVAVLDGGIDYDHPDLDDNYVDGVDFVPADYPGGDGDPMDLKGHGTHCAGIIAAEDNDFGVVGVAPEASLYAVQVLDATGSGYYSWLIAGLEWCVDEGMQVASMSLGGSSRSEALQAACNSAYGEGVLLVAAAGNAGNPRGKGNNVGYPARYESVIAVAATDSNDQRASWSSTGDAVELAAPGVAVYSTLLGEEYGEKSGTSMACPHVAGTAALVIAAGITDVRYQLQVTADDLGPSGPDTLYGYGIVDADEAVGVPSPPPNDPPSVTITNPADGSTFDSGATIPFEGTASDLEDDDLTADDLVWTSDKDDQIGTGGSFSATLSDGVHTITASVTDSGGETGSDSVTITVGTLATLSVTVTTDSPSYAHRETVPITVTVTGDQGGIEGASVHLVITTPKGGASAKDGTTDGDGIATLTHKVNAGRDGVGTYTVEATASKDGYDPRSASTTFEVTK